jgi:hypothetical protein
MMNVKAITIIIYSNSCFWMIPWRLNVICQRFGTQCSIFIGRVNIKMKETKCSETSAHKIQKPGNHLKERIQHSEHGESLKSRIIYSIIKPREKKLCFTLDVQIIRPLQLFFVNVR